MSRLRPHLLVLFLLGLFALAGQHQWLREDILDTRFKIFQRDVSKTIALVEIDARSLKEIGAWPWSRRLHADLVRQLQSAHVAEIVFDVDFSSASLPRDDQAFADALRDAGGSVVLPAFRQRASSNGGAANLHSNFPIPLLADHAWLATVNVVPDRDGVIRHYGYGQKIDGTAYPSVGALLAGAGGLSTRPFRIDYGFKSTAMPTASYIDVLRGDETTLASLRGKKVIISGTAAELGDRFTTPNGRILPGSVIQALAAESISQNRALIATSPLLGLLIVSCMVAVMAAFWRRTRAALRVAAIVVLGVAIEGVAIAIQFRFPIAFDTSLPLVAAVAYLAVIAIDEIDLRGLLQKASERRFSDVALSLRDGLIGADRDGVITLYNPGAEAIFGYSAKEAVGRPFDSLVASIDDAPFALTQLPLADLRRGPGHIVELTGVRSGGETFDLECSFSAWGGVDKAHYGVILRDVSARKRQQARVRYLATMDTVTGLHNRDSLLARLAEDIQKPQPVLLMLVAVDRFQQIIDVEGHSFGDALIFACAARLREAAPGANFSARLKTDTFALLFEDVDEGNAASRALIDAFSNQPLDFDGYRHRASITVGLAGSGTAAGAEAWVGNAHFALTDARSKAISRPVIFQSQMRETVEKRHALEGELREAFTRREFELFYQPQVDLLTGRVIGAEALIRWRHPIRGYVAPGEFIAVVNETSLSDDVAQWVMQTACEQAARWQCLGHPLRVGVNLTQSQIATGRLAKDVADILTKSGLRADLLELEVTENIVLENSERTQATLSALRALGVKTAFDDFGTGFGSLTYLKAFSLDKIKIDRSFVMNLRDTGDDAAIVKSTIDLSRALGLSVIAEGVETSTVAEALLEMGCNEGQGYHFGRPMTAAEFEARFCSEPTALVA